MKINSGLNNIFRVIPRLIFIHRLHGLHGPACKFNCNRQSGRLNTLSRSLDFKRIKWLQSQAEAIFTELENHCFSAIVSSWPDSGRVSEGCH
jgi:hypothetical protein